MKDASAPPSQTVTVRSLLVGWANEQDAWVRHLVSEVVVSRRAMTDGQLDTIYQTFLRKRLSFRATGLRWPNSAMTPNCCLAWYLA